MVSILRLMAEWTALADFSGLINFSAVNHFNFKALARIRPGGISGRIRGTEGDQPGQAVGVMRGRSL